MTPTARSARVFVLFSALIGDVAIAGAKQEEVPPVAGADPGVLVVRVEPGSPAASAGIVRGDIILSVDGRDVATGAEIRGAVTARKPGDTVKAGDPLFSAETEKTTVEVESEYSGKITRLLVAQGDTVKLFSEIAEIDTED